MCIITHVEKLHTDECTVCIILSYNTYIINIHDVLYTSYNFHTECTLAIQLVAITNSHWVDIIRICSDSSPTKINILPGADRLYIHVYKV